MITDDERGRNSEGENVFYMYISKRTGCSKIRVSDDVATFIMYALITSETSGILRNVGAMLQEINFFFYLLSRNI
jgi:hypothetical protein